MGAPEQVEADPAKLSLSIDAQSYPSPQVAQLDAFQAQSNELSSIPTPPLQLPDSLPPSQPAPAPAPVPIPAAAHSDMQSLLNGSAASPELNGIANSDQTFGGSTPAPLGQPADVPPAPVVPLPTASQIPPPLHHTQSDMSIQAQPPTPAPTQLPPAATSAQLDAVASSLPAPSPLSAVPSTTQEDAAFAGSSSPATDSTGLKRSAEGAEDQESKRPKLEAFASEEQLAIGGGHSAQSAPPPATNFDGTFMSLPPAPAQSVPPPDLGPVQPAPVQTFLPPASSYPPNAYAPAPAPHPASSELGPVNAFTKDQHKQALNVLRSLKKNKNAFPFLKAVDPVALLIPDYFRLITRPSDLGSVEQKLNATGKAITAAAKVGKTYAVDYSGTGEWEGKSTQVYRTCDEFVEDVNRIWDNCFRYNGAREVNPVSGMAGLMKDQADALLAKLPSAPLVEYQPSPAPQQPPFGAPQSNFTPPPAVLPAASPSAAPHQPTPRERRPSHSFVPTIRQSEDGTRPKREIHAPARELAYHDEPTPSSAAPTKARRVSGKVAQEELRFCKEVMKELFKKSHESYAYPFYDPVNWVALNIPHYPQIVKHPMDLGTIRKKLDDGQYSAPIYPQFEADVRLVFNNCYAFNPAGTPVNDMGRRLEGVFEFKWHERPTPLEEDDEDSDDGGISAMEQQLKQMQANIERMKHQKELERQQRRNSSYAQQQMYAPQPVAPPKQPRKTSNGDSLYGAPKPAKASQPKKARVSGGSSAPQKKQQRKAEASSYYEMPQEVTFEMKRELAMRIVTFEGAALEQAIQIIKDGSPQLLGQADQEVELDIDQLDQATMLNLYLYVCPPPPGARISKPQQRKQAPAPSKRKNLDEIKESERIEALEARLREFDSGARAGPIPTGAAADESSDSSSDSGGESDSESEDED